jgi:hypothetical protein
VARYADAPLLRGYLPDSLSPIVPGSLSALARRVGDGSIILLMDEPAFRGFWLGSARSISNAVLLGGVL